MKARLGPFYQHMLQPWCCYELTVHSGVEERYLQVYLNAQGTMEVCAWRRSISTRSSTDFLFFGQVYPLYSPAETVVVPPTYKGVERQCSCLPSAGTVGTHKGDHITHLLGLIVVPTARQHCSAPHVRVSKAHDLWMLLTQQ